MEIFDSTKLKKVLDVVFMNFKLTEKNEYSKQDIVRAEKALGEFDVFEQNNLTNLVKKRLVRVFMLSNNLGVCGVESATGNILFLSAKTTKDYAVLIEYLTALREDDPDGRLVMLAFSGQVPILKKVGFQKLYNTEFIKNGIKFVPMQFNYIQIDSEI